jgi:hypothetical protein
MRTKRADSQDGKKRPDSTQSDSPIHGSKLKSQEEEMWHVLTDLPNKPLYQSAL